MAKSKVASSSIKHIVCVIICVSSLVSTIGACTCAVRPPVCYLFPETDAIFVGDVESVSSDPDVYPDKVKIKVAENIKGMPFDFANTLNHMTSCSFSYKKGEKFLFFAGIDEKDRTFFSAGLCSRTTRFSSDLADLNIIREISQGRSRLMIWLTVNRFIDNPLEGVEAEVISPKLNLKAKSDKSGDLRFEVPSVGKYLVRVWVPKDKIWSPVLGPNEFDQIKMLRKSGKTRKGSYRDFEVIVRGNQCGWLNVPLYNKSDT